MESKEICPASDKVKRSKCDVQEKPRSQISAGKSLNNQLSHDSEQVFFVASEAAISPSTVKLQFQVKHQNWPVMLHCSNQEASNNYVVPTERDEAEQCSVEFACVVFDSVNVGNVELACTACGTCVKGTQGSYRDICQAHYWDKPF